MIEVSYQIVTACSMFIVTLLIITTTLASLLRSERVEHAATAEQLSRVADELKQCKDQYVEEHEFLQRTRVSMERVNGTMRTYKKLYEDSALTG